ncbi:MAG: transporter, partial [Bacteroidota bacterium]
MNLRITLVALFCLALFGMAQAQSAWTQPAQNGYFQLGVTNIGPYDGIYGSVVDRFELPREVRDFTIQAYGEYGITDKLTLIGAIPLKALSVGDESDAFSGFSFVEEGSQFALGNINLGARYSLYSGAVNVAAQLLVELPGGGLDEATGLRPGYDAFSFKPTVSVGAGLGKGFVYGHVGVPLRTNNYSHSFL